MNNTMPATQDDFELVTISLSEHRNLKYDSELLNALWYFGVQHWPYYVEALCRIEGDN